jgi:hypothetical protein
VLSKALSIYSLPADLLDALTVRSIQSTPAIDVSAEQEEDTGDSEEPVASSGTSLTCQTCLNVSFANLEEQRAHFKSDWHRYNAKVSMEKSTGKNKGVLTAEEFEEINDGESFLTFILVHLAKMTIQQACPLSLDLLLILRNPTHQA